VSNPAPAALFAGAMLVLATAAIARADTTPPPELTARDVPGIAATPDRTWTATVRVLRENGIPVPAGASYGWLPAHTEVGGVALPHRNRVLLDPFTAVGDGRHLPMLMAHEAAHLASHHAHTRTVPHGDPLEEAAAEAIARDLHPVIRHRLRLLPMPIAGAYQQQVTWIRRATTRACRATMGGTRHQVERCARHTRRWFLVASDTDRQAFAARWATGRVPGVHYPTTAPARTIAQQLIVERRRWAAERRAYRQRIRALVHRPDAHVAFQLAGLAYGVDWRHLRACALSEGYREAERWHRVDVQAHAAAWMWSVGRIREWTGKGC